MQHLQKPLTVIHFCYLLNKFFSNCMSPSRVFHNNYCTNKKSSNCSKYTENKNNLLQSATNKKAILTQYYWWNFSEVTYFVIFVKKSHKEDTNFMERKINDKWTDWLNLIHHVKIIAYHCNTDCNINIINNFDSYLCLSVLLDTRKK